MEPVRFGGRFAPPAIQVQRNFTRLDGDGAITVSDLGVTVEGVVFGNPHRFRQGLIGAALLGVCGVGFVAAPDSLKMKVLGVLLTATVAWAIWELFWDWSGRAVQCDLPFSDIARAIATPDALVLELSQPSFRPLPGLVRFVPVESATRVTAALHTHGVRVELSAAELTFS
jgi:hypothetical protein